MMAKAPFILEDTPLSPEAQKIAIDELRETPDVVEKGYKELRELLKADDTMFYHDDDDFLRIFLRPTKYYAQSAYELMKRISEFRFKHKDLFYDLLPDSEKDAFINHNVVNVLKTRDHKRRRVLLVNVGGSWNTSAVTPDQLLRILYLVHLSATLEPETQVRGCVVIMDYRDLGMKQVTAFGPTFAMKLMTFIQDAMPVRLKEVHFVYNPFIFNMVWKIIKPMVKDKLNKRIHFHGSKMDSLHKFIPASHLPKDYGGELPKIDYTGKDWFPAIGGYVAHYEKWNSCGKHKQK